MDRLPVNSSHIASIGYNPDNQILEVQFKDGGLYQYSGVPEKIYSALMAAPSKGKYLFRYVKGKFPYNKLN